MYNKMTMEKEKLPSYLREIVKSNLREEKLLIVLSSDIKADGSFGEEWLIVTNKKLFVYSDKGEKLQTLKLSELKEVEVVDLIGSSALEVNTGKHIYRIILYSNARNSEFYQVAEDINNIIKGKEIATKGRVKQKVICEICNHPIPEEFGKCPKCTDKSKTLLRIMSFAKPYSMTILLIVLAMVIGSFFGLIPPYLSKLFIDYILKPDPVTKTFTNSGWLIWATIGLFLSYAAQQLFSGFFLERLSGSLGFKTVYDVRAAVYEKLQELSMSYFDKNQTGAILARVNQDTGELQRLLVDFVPVTLEGIIMFFGVGAFLVFLSWELTLYILIPIIPTVIFLKWIFPKVRTYFHKFYHKRSMLSVLVNDSVSGIRVIKAFGQEKVEIDKFKKRSGEYRDSGIEMVRQWGVYHPILHLFIMFGTVLVWYIGGEFILRNKMSLGDIVAYTGYLSMFYNPIRTLTRMVETISNSLSAAERVFDIVDTEPEIKDNHVPVEMKEIQGKIEFDNATFGYNKYKPVIKRMSLEIQPNEMIGLIGRSGAGKSTMVNLICRLYDVNKGEIRIDGVDIKNIKLSDLRSQIGIVLQETFLFNGTIYDNIAYAKPGASREEVIRASIAANAHEFIIKKPDGYDTDVGERGNSLSGGEKQMVSIARAILRNPRILILDEATSSVDVQTEKKIQDALEKLTKNRTTIAIAHRLSTLRHCNRLIAIKEGKIVEVGTHKELMAKKGLFHKLITMQREFSEQASRTRAV
ncbi:MAG: hypothetical protein A2452_02720 [Candidatus Firestonebacteria bacterium RIFOXYC2_FULL_39_67]|nr:MAG: hypothetical protein A2536_02135 [Candidatus Firestonebacteria bacterium RIFOXYD2_FULL_39_29]OGF55373.1 MAG: hypothetical protein A2452_02720 [Candidatus Firestonebacteria bacterium RIFOXYC2_FULL_39_67]OGF56748.1 MAG: hypothetical protein A2497_06605 [Candidatus Firestonebacteria bacterium RifOxyC12_full_39_7]